MSARRHHCPGRHITATPEYPLQVQRRKHRKHERGRFALFATIMAIFLYGCVAFQYHPRTPLGIQCPTATVQEVLEPVMCCGKVVRYEKRAPKPGESTFVQCNCAEKKAAEHVASAAVPVLQCFILPIVLVEPQAFLEPYQEPWTTLPSESTINTPPLVPPPNLA